MGAWRLGQDGVALARGGINWKLDAFGLPFVTRLWRAGVEPKGIKVTSDLGSVPGVEKLRALLFAETGPQNRKPFR